MRALLLNSTYQPISFISERKVMKMVVKEKVEILSNWDDFIHWGSGKIRAPAIIKLNYYVKWIPKRSRFSRFGIFKRDKNTCQYCGKVFKPIDLTIDHVIPKSVGGKLCWTNCVASCFPCNNKKGNHTLEQVGMKLLKTPIVPISNPPQDLITMNYYHPDWMMYLGEW